MSPRSKASVPEDRGRSRASVGLKVTQSELGKRLSVITVDTSEIRRDALMGKIVVLRTTKKG